MAKRKRKKQQAVTETKVNRWQITSNVAPIYFSSASKGSPINQQFADNSKSYEKNLSYGVGVNYAINKKWSIRGGVNKLTLGYNTNNIVYYAGLSDANANGEVFSPSNIQESRNVTVIVEDNTAANTVSFDNVPGKKAGSLNQTMGYVEVPVELSYKILDDKFGISLIGGMSTLFLNENSLSVVSPGMSTSIGKASNLNDVSFTSNIGIGFKYKFWKSFEANVEPKLKYQINTFSENAGGFKPYFIGLYSGISFNF
ncbi:outer membrane beta-barrel protein [Flavobacterium lindanitolerans]|nr:outer membrane beta-barrel protein [Flavobacterium lindanitolerans]